ncbi:hypothetical protein NUACC21_38560 [Scytonema sp. NUACC21]
MLGIGFHQIITLKKVTFICNRQQLECKYITSTLIEQRVVERFPLISLQGAKFVKNEFEGKTHYNIYIQTAQGEFYFGYWPNKDFSKSQAIVSRINQFVKNPRETSLVINQYQNRLLEKTLYALYFIFFGIYWFFRESLVTCSFDKSLGTFIYKHGKLIKTETVRGQLSEIADINVDGYRAKHEAYILLTSSKRLPLTLRLPLFHQQEHKNLVNDIRDFLDWRRI